MIRALLFPSVLLFLVWILVILIINPEGEFMVNDDWSYLKALETLNYEGRIADTGWGPAGKPGGPAAIVHLIWGLAFTKAFGFSLTTLRTSVLVMGILGSMGLLTLLKFTGASRWPAFLGTLTLVFNPLFLSQSFTFMTDITFASIAVFSLLFLHLGIEKSRYLFLVFGLLFALAAVLVRQIGLVIPLGFVITCFLHPRGRELGRFRMLLLAVSITVIPWLAYEFFLYYSGSTPITQYQGFQNILGYPLSKGILGYFVFLSGRLLIVLGYTCFLVSPVMGPRFIQNLRKKNFRIFFSVLTTIFLLFELGILAGAVNPPVQFYRNIIFDFGIGPILLKDTYILGIQRTANIPTCLFYLLVYWAALAVAVVFMHGVLSLKCLLNSHYKDDSSPIGFTATFSLIAAMIYIVIILLTGFHDRYLITVCIFFLVWLSSQMPTEKDLQWSFGSLMLCFIPLIFMASFSILGTRDFMEMKRGLNEAHYYLTKELKVDPCQIDGGFEFNGYHCYRNDFNPHEGLSWWWVTKEDYLVTLGPLPGYRTIKTFPFSRYFGPDGAVHILCPFKNAELPTKYFISG